MVGCSKGCQGCGAVAWGGGSVPHVGAALGCGIKALGLWTPACMGLHSPRGGAGAKKWARQPRSVRGVGPAGPRAAGHLKDPTPRTQRTPMWEIPYPCTQQDFATPRTQRTLRGHFLPKASPPLARALGGCCWCPPPLDVAFWGWAALASVKCVHLLVVWLVVWLVSRLVSILVSRPQFAQLWTPVLLVCVGNDCCKTWAFRHQAQGFRFQGSGFRV